MGRKFYTTDAEVECDPEVTIVIERCNMAQTADCNDANRCVLDVNFLDWSRFRLVHESHTSYTEKQTDFWASQGVYFNFRWKGYLASGWLDHGYDDNGRLKEKTWTGTFPEGSAIAGYRCYDPNHNNLEAKYGAEEHTATCTCTGGKCEWDRELPVCTNHGYDHSGYT